MSSDQLTYFYQVRDGDNEELLYSLRSVAKYGPPGEVVLAGHCPDNIRNVRHVPVIQDEDRPNKNAWKALVFGIETVKGPVVMMNDDFFFLKPMDRVPLITQGQLATVLSQHQKAGSGWHRRFQTTAAFVGMDEWSYEGHFPFPTEAEPLIETLSWMSNIFEDPWHWQWRTIHAQHAGLTHDLVMPDYKAHVGNWKPPEDAIFASSNDLTWERGEFGKQIREMFPEESIYG